MGEEIDIVADEIFEEEVYASLGNACTHLDPEDIKIIENDY